MQMKGMLMMGGDQSSMDKGMECFQIIPDKAGDYVIHPQKVMKTLFHNLRS